MTSITRIEPLTKDNYESWKLQAEAILVKNDSWQFVNGLVSKPTGTADILKWQQEDAKAKADLILSISSPELRHIRGCITSREVWLKLESIYASRGTAKKVTFLKRLLMHKMSVSGDIHEEMGLFFDAVDQLESMDVKIHEDLLSIILLYALPTCFDNFRCDIESRDDLPKPDILKVKILEAYESRMANDNAQRASTMYAYKRTNHWDRNISFNKRYGQTYRQRKKELICYRCNRTGHKASDCQENKTQYCTSYLDINDKKLICLNLSGSHECCTFNISDHQWVLDSGCTSHLCNDVRKFKNIETVTGILKLASNVTTEVKGKGVVRMSVSNGKSSQMIEFKDTLYVPNLRTNLISVSKITDKGYDIVFSNDIANVVDKTGKTILTAVRKGNLYYVKECEFANATIENKVDLHRWHERFGHLNGKDVVKVLEKVGEKINGNNISILRDCDICAKGNMSALPFVKSGGPCNKKLHIVFSDIVGPMNCESKSGAKYFITFIDDCTR